MALHLLDEFLILLQRVAHGVHTERAGITGSRDGVDLPTVIGRVEISLPLIVGTGNVVGDELYPVLLVTGGSILKEEATGQRDGVGGLLPVHGIVLTIANGTERGRDNHILVKDVTELMVHGAEEVLVEGVDACLVEFVAFIKGDLQTALGRTQHLRTGIGIVSR